MYYQTLATKALVQQRTNEREAKAWAIALFLVLLLAVGFPTSSVAGNCQPITVNGDNPITTN